MNQELLKMRIRSMMYRYQTELLDIPEEDADMKILINNVINDLIELSSMLNC